MVKGGTNFRKSSQRIYQKRKAPPGKKKVSVVNVVADMVAKGSGTSVDEVGIGSSKQTISEAKIKEIPVPDNTEEFTAPTGYRFMDMSILEVLTVIGAIYFAETVMQEAALIVMITLLILVFLLMVPGRNLDLLPLMMRWQAYL